MTEPVVSYRAVNKSLDDGVSHVGVDPRQGGVAAEPVAHQAHQEVLVRTVVIADQGSSSLSPAGVLPCHSPGTHLARLRLPPENSPLFKCRAESPGTFLAD